MVSVRSARIYAYIIPGDADRGSTTREDAMRLAALVLLCAALSIRSIVLPTAAAPMPLQRARLLQESLDAALTAIVSGSDGSVSGSGAVAADAAELLLRHAAGPLADALLSHALDPSSPSSGGGGSSRNNISSRIPPRRAGASSSLSSSPSPSSSGGPWGAQQLELQHPAARAVIKACMRAMRVLPHSSSSSPPSSSSAPSSSSGPSSSSSGKSSSSSQSSSFQPALMEEIQAGVRLLVEQKSSSSFPLVRWAGETEVFV